MQRIMFAIISIVLIGACAQSGDQSAMQSNSADLATHNDTISYAIGMDVGRNLKQQDLDINPESFTHGFSGAYNDEETKLTEDEVRTVLIAFQQEMRNQQQDKSQAQAKGNREAGEKYRKDYSQNKDVVILDNGLMYKVLEAGDGEKPTADDRVRVHYTGKLIDGTVFDSSVERGEPAVFGVGDVIQGWTEILQLMPVGSKWEVVIPADLGYGDRQAGPTIKPGSTLVFEIELLGIES